MGRKRLLTILAAVTAAVGLQVGTASAQTISLPGVGDITLEAGECLEVGVDISLADVAKLDPSVCVSDDGVEVEGGVSSGDQTIVDAGEVTKPVQDATKKVAETVKGAESKTPAPSPDPSPDPSPSPSPSEPSKGDGGGGDTSSKGGSTSGGSDSGGAKSPDVAASGDAEERSSSRERASLREFGALRAINSDFAADSPLGPGVAGPVRTFGGLGSTDDLAAPQVADAGQVVPGVDERLTPQVAPAPDQQEAVLANSSPLRNIPEAPIALQLLAAALVLGAATVWTIASRELGTGTTTHG